MASKLLTLEEAISIIAKHFPPATPLGVAKLVDTGDIKIHNLGEPVTKDINYTLSSTAYMQLTGKLLTVGGSPVKVKSPAPKLCDSCGGAQHLGQLCPPPSVNWCKHQYNAIKCPVCTGAIKSCTHGNIPAECKPCFDTKFFKAMPGKPMPMGGAVGAGHPGGWTASIGGGGGGGGGAWGGGSPGKIVVYDEAYEMHSTPPLTAMAEEKTASDDTWVDKGYWDKAVEPGQVVSTTLPEAYVCECRHPDCTDGAGVYGAPTYEVREYPHDGTGKLKAVDMSIHHAKVTGHSQCIVYERTHWVIPPPLCLTLSPAQEHFLKTLYAKEFSSYPQKYVMGDVGYASLSPTVPTQASVAEAISAAVNQGLLEVSTAIGVPVVTPGTLAKELCAHCGKKYIDHDQHTNCYPPGTTSPFSDPPKFTYLKCVLHNVNHVECPQCWKMNVCAHGVHTENACQPCDKLYKYGEHSLMLQKQKSFNTMTCTHGNPYLPGEMPMCCWNEKKAKADKQKQKIEAMLTTLEQCVHGVSHSKKCKDCVNESNIAAEKFKSAMGFLLDEPKLKGADKPKGQHICCGHCKGDNHYPHGNGCSKPLTDAQAKSVLAEAKKPKGLAKKGYTAEQLKEYQGKWKLPTNPHIKSVAAPDGNDYCPHGIIYGKCGKPNCEGYPEPPTMYCPHQYTWQECTFCTCKHGNGPLCIQCEYITKVKQEAKPGFLPIHPDYVDESIPWCKHAKPQTQCVLCTDPQVLCLTCDGTGIGEQDVNGVDLPCNICKGKGELSAETAQNLSFSGTTCVHGYGYTKTGKAICGACKEKPVYYDTPKPSFGVQFSKQWKSLLEDANKYTYYPWLDGPTKAGTSEDKFLTGGNAVAGEGWYTITKDAKGNTISAKKYSDCKVPECPDKGHGCTPPKEAEPW